MTKEREVEILVALMGEPVEMLAYPETWPVLRKALVERIQVIESTEE